MQIAARSSERIIYTTNSGVNNKLNPDHVSHEGVAFEFISASVPFINGPNEGAALAADHKVPTICRNFA